MKALLLFLFLPWLPAADHGVPVTAQRETPPIPVVAPRTKAAAGTGDLATAQVYASPICRDRAKALEFCASFGERLPNSAERRAAGLRADACLRPKDPIAEMAEMCPVGEMDYCDGKRCHEDCRGVKSTIGGRDAFVCGNYARALSRCLDNRMGRKSWQVHVYCGTRRWFSSWDIAHAMTLVTLPSSRLNHVRYCVVEPQRVSRDRIAKAVDVCWEAKYAASPAVPEDAKRSLCARFTRRAGKELPVHHVSTHPGDTHPRGNPDYVNNQRVFEHLIYKTGIPGEDLVSPFRRPKEKK